MDEYRTCAKEAESEFTEKKSRFIGRIRPVQTEEEARAFLESVRRQNHDARHHCWCYRLKDGTVRYSDDGEPQGTAGQPMLAVFEHEEITDFICVVTRYFGGILLGTGGLTRAYSKSAKDALTQAGIAQNCVWDCLEIRSNYSLFEQIKVKLFSKNAVIEDVQYGEMIVICALCAADKTESLSQELCELSGGTVVPTVTKQTYRAVLISDTDA